MTELSSIAARYMPKIIDVVNELSMMRKALSECVTAVRELAHVMEKRLEDVHSADS